MDKLSKRKYDALTTKGSGGKWYTGWDGFAFTQEREDQYVTRYPLCDVDSLFGQQGGYIRVEKIKHDCRKLLLRFDTTARGRSSAVAVFSDEEGFQYQMSLNTLDLILQLLFHKRGEIHKTYDVAGSRWRGETWLEGTFIQIKRGQNYFIEPAEVNNNLKE